MTQPIPHTAVLVFIRNPREEVLHKPFLKSAGLKTSLRLVASLNRQVVNVARKSGLDTFVLTSENQIGASFAQRFTKAIQQTFAQGYDNVICVGNDCIDLTTDKIRRTRELLNTNQQVLGPTEDGGIYLFGIQQNAFCPQTFVDLPWQQETLFDELIQQARHKGHLTGLLTRSRDADDKQSFLEALQATPFLAFKRLLQQVLGWIKQEPHLPVTIVLKNVFIPLDSLKGPPFSA